jgi:hypothetical protein
VPDKTKKKSDKGKGKAESKVTAESTENLGTTLPPVVLRPLPPIFFGPSISSLSPSGAIVGGSGFVLTVNGAGYNADAVVMWNGVAQPTTFISANQLTASIVPANIAAIGPVPVTVSRPPFTSPASTFNVIPNISATVNALNQVTQSFASLQQFQALQPGLIQSLANLQTFLNIESATINDQQGQLSDAQNQVATLNTQNSALNAQVTQQNATIAQLQSQLAANKTQTARPVDVAQSFKGVVDQIQQTARNSGGVQTTLTNMNIQLKTLVNVQTPAAPHDASGSAPPPEAVLVFPDPTALPDPNSLSTVTFSFSAIPNIRDAVPTTPPTPAPDPTPPPTPPPPTPPPPTPPPPPPTPAPPTPPPPTPAPAGGPRTSKAATTKSATKKARKR